MQNKKMDNKDRFEEIYAVQAKFTEKFFREKFNSGWLKGLQKNKKESIKWNKEYILSIIKEVTELLDEISWKMHVDKDDEDVKDNFLEEAIDAMKYLLGMLYINGFTADDIYDKFIEKSAVVEAKYDQEKMIKKINTDKGHKLAFIDIDGVVGKFPESFLDFVYKNHNMMFDTHDELKKNLLESAYLKIKREYRLSGAKASIDMVEGAKEYLDWLNFHGYYVILITARPYKKYFRIYPDTLKWLKFNDINYDAIIWEQEKEKYIATKFTEFTNKFFIDDDIDNVKKMSTQGFDVYLKFNKLLYPAGYTIEDLKGEVANVRNAKKPIHVFENFDELKTLDFLKETSDNK